MADTLSELQQKAARKPKLEAKLRELQDQRREYGREVISLRVAFRKEQEDVEKLEGKSLANYFFMVVGKLDDKLDQERQEAYAAKVKLDAAQHMLTGINADIAMLQSQLVECRVAEARYQEELKKKRNTLRTSGTEQGVRLLETEQKLGALETRKREIREAISAGMSARGTADRILSELESADDWNTWDLVGGGGIITHMAKHGHLDSAQDLVSELQDKLRRFKTELTDIRITANVQADIGGFLRFADYFFDGLFADWAVRDRISNSRSSVYETRNRISAVMDQLRAMESEADREAETLKGEIDRLVADS